MVFTLVLLCLLPLSSFAATISYSVQQLSGNRWTYGYELTAQPSDSEIREFTIFFDRNLFSNLQVVATPAQWDSLVVQPDQALASNGFFDALALGAGLVPGDSLGGFAIAFDFLGTGTPGAQSFDIVDPDTFETLSSGRTSSSTPPPHDLPEPAPFMLMALPIAALLARRALSAT
ncbi:hypothetical protein IA69_26215 [Massilia sp. JS1662]|nr:hypothetical protein IA69_26215 [Massilia sp. JS1662]